MDLERIYNGLFVGGLVAGVMILGLLTVQIAGRPDKSRRRVRATVVGFEDRYDESYKVMEPYPVVALELDGKRRQSVLVAGYWKWGNKPAMKEGDSLWVNVDPGSPDEVVMTTAFARMYAFALVLGVVVAAFATVRC